MSRIVITYVTSSNFKREENAVFRRHCHLSDGRRVEDVFDFHITDAVIREVLEVDITVMVQEEVKAAYSRLKIPCIVEHAGLIFEDYLDAGYPGGLTKPMWNTLSTSFIAETRSAGRAARARAVVAYCDGKSVTTFVGETTGTISDEPRGSRTFYWDTVFIPNEHNPERRTYAEIVDDSSLSLKFKVTQLSQSSRAMLGFLNWRSAHEPDLWDVTY